MNIETYRSLRDVARHALLIEKHATSLANLGSALKRAGVPEIAMLGVGEARASLKEEADRRKRDAWKLLEGTTEGRFMEEAVGLGASAAIVLGCLPPLTAHPDDGQPGFPHWYHVWSYCGLGDRADEAKVKGQKLGYNPLVKSHAIARLALPCIKNRESPYRAAYDDRKARTAESHPPMLDAGEGCEFCDRARGKTKALRAEKNQTRERKALALDCSNVGGVHWTDGHRHADALRVVAKAILKDLWLVSHGERPAVGASHELRTIRFVPPAA